MDVKTALAERKSTRAFLDKEVPIDVINTIIEQAKTAPSGANTQPWQVAVVLEKVRQIFVINWKRLFVLEIKVLWTITTIRQSGLANIKREGGIVVYCFTPLWK